MIQRISVRNEYLHISDEDILNHILDVLREEFLFMPLDNYEIEVHEKDFESVLRRLISIKKQLIKK